MATVYWLGFAQAVPGVRTLTIGGAPAAGDTVTVTVTGSGKFVKYTVVTGDTTSTVASAVQALWAASPEAEVTEITATVSGAVVTFTGPSDGAPFTITSSKTGTVTVTDANVTTETGPHHADNVTNYSGGTLPSNGDTLVFAQGANGPKYALTAITATGLTVRRDAEFTGQIGLFEDSPNGYREYRTQFLDLDFATLNFESSNRDVSQQFRIHSLNGSAVTINVYGADQPQRGQPPVLELYGMPASSTLRGSNASVGVALQPAQTGTVVASLTNSVFEAGPGSTLTTPAFVDCAATLRATASTLTVSGDSSEVILTNAAAVTGALTVQEGAVRWRSTGSPGSAVVGTGATLDLFNAPAALTAFNVSAYANCTIDNRAGKMAANSVITPVNCTWGEINYLSKSNEPHTL